MKPRSITLLLLFSLLLFSVNGLSPKEEMVKLYTFNDADGYNSILPGTVVNFTVLIKNLTENTISNITLFSEYAKDYQTDTVLLLESPVGSFDGAPVNLTSPQLSITDKISGASVGINFLNITKNNFTMNIPSMESGDQISFSYSLNFTNAEVYSPEAASMIYYDYWGDLQARVISSISPSIRIETTEEDPILSYLPTYNSEEEVDYKIILLISLAVLLVALLGRVLYLRNPFSL